MIKHILWLTPDTASQKSAVVDLFQHLQQACRHQAADILPMFLPALSNTSKPPSTMLTTGDHDAPPLLLPSGKTCLMSPPKQCKQHSVHISFTPKQTIASLPMDWDPYNGGFRSWRLIVAYSQTWPSNLWMLIFPRKFKKAPNNHQVSTSFSINDKISILWQDFHSWEMVTSSCII